jgi:hypothetical protein
MANKTSKSNEGYFAKYKTSNKEAGNRLKKLERQLKLQPGNEKQIALAIKNIAHRRKTPVTPQWSATSRRIAQLTKEFTGKSNGRKAGRFTEGEMAKIFTKPTHGYNPFSLGAVAKVVQWA